MRRPEQSKKAWFRTRTPSCISPAKAQHVHRHFLFRKNRIYTGYLLLGPCDVIFPSFAVFLKMLTLSVEKVIFWLPIIYLFILELQVILPYYL